MKSVFTFSLSFTSPYPDCNALEQPRGQQNSLLHYIGTCAKLFIKEHKAHRLLHFTETYRLSVTDFKY